MWCFLLTIGSGRKVQAYVVSSSGMRNWVKVHKSWVEWEWGFPQKQRSRQAGSRVHFRARLVPSTEPKELILTSSKEWVGFECKVRDLELAGRWKQVEADWPCGGGLTLLIAKSWMMVSSGASWSSYCSICSKKIDLTKVRSGFILGMSSRP